MKKDIRGFTPRSQQLFREYNWPGNVRELKNIVERSVIYCQRDWAEPLGIKTSRLDHGEEESRLLSLREMERTYIEKVLAKTGGNKSEAARILGISRTTLRDKLNN